MSKKNDSKRIGAAWWVVERRRVPGARGRGWVAALLVGSLALGAQACSDSEPDPELAEEVPETVSTEELGRIGGRIYNEPDRAREILQEANLTPEKFEERVRAVTNDPAQAREYTRGFEVVARPARANETLDSIGVLPGADTTSTPGAVPSPSGTTPGGTVYPTPPPTP